MLQLTRAIQSDRQLRFGHATNTGQPDGQNSDAYLIFPTEIPTPWEENPEPTWFVLLANGDQKHPSSRVASQLAVESVYQELVNKEKAGHSISKRLDKALLQAHTSILETSLGDPNLLGMQTSMLAAAITSGTVHFARSGDYGAFLFRKGRIYRVLLENNSASLLCDAPGPLFTRAETTALQTTNSATALGLGNVDGVEIVQKIQLQNIDSPNGLQNPLLTENAGLFDNNNGADSAAKLLTLQPNDVLILCSSSMTETLSPLQIRTAIANHPISEVADQLIRSVKEKGVQDDCTAVVLRWADTMTKPEGTRPNLSSFNWPRRKSLLLLMTLLVACSIWFATGILLDTQPKIAGQDQAVETIEESVDTLAALNKQPLNNKTAPDNLLSNAVLAEPQEEPPAESADTGLAGSASIEREAISSEPLGNATALNPTVANPAVAESVTIPLTTEELTLENRATEEQLATKLAIDNLFALFYAIPASMTSAIQELQIGQNASAESPAAPVVEVAPSAAITLETTTVDQPIVEVAEQANSPAAESSEPALPTPIVQRPAQPSNAAVEPETPGTATTSSQTEIATQTEEVQDKERETATIYLLKEGDNLWTIAWQNDLTVDDLLEANPFIKDKDQILNIGTAIVIPRK